jgi:hypothetical protein
MAVEVNIQRSGRAVLVEVTGELDIEGAAALSAAPDADVDLVSWTHGSSPSSTAADSPPSSPSTSSYGKKTATLRLFVRPESMMRHILRITDLDTGIPVVDKPETSLVAAS